MTYLLFALIALCIVTLGLVSIVAVFCYKQDNIVLLLRNKTTVKKDAISSEIAVDIDKKENSK